MKKLMCDLLIAVLVSLQAVWPVVGGTVTPEIPPTTQTTIQTHLENLDFQVRSANTTSTWDIAGTYAAADFAAGVDPAVVLTVAGTYKITANVCVKLVTAGTINNNQTAAFKLRRTNNTAADLTDTEATIHVSTHGATLPTYTATCIVISADAYTTTLTNDSITVFGDLTSGITVGQVVGTYVDIYAERIF